MGSLDWPSLVIGVLLLAVVYFLVRAGARLLGSRTRPVPPVVPPGDHPGTARRLAPEGGSAVPNSHIQTVADAWHLLAGEQGDTRSFQSAWARCPGPPIMQFGDIVDVAVQVLEGDSLATQRYRDMLSLMDGRSLAERTRRLAHVSGDQSGSVDYWSSLRTQVSKRLATASRVTAPVPRDEFVALASAAILVGGDDPLAVHTNLGILFDQICELRPFRGTLLAAEAVRFGEPGALRVFHTSWEAFTGECGPDDGPLPPRPSPQPAPRRQPTPCATPWPPEAPDVIPDDAELLEKVACTAEMVLAIRTLEAHGYFPGPVTPYRITGVSDPRACAGHTITITGSGFGSVAGGVRFTTADGTTVVTPTSWSDTSITVVVPPEATCGPLSLSILEDRVEACGVFIEIHRPATGVTEFAGGATRIRSLWITGADAPGCVVPGQSVRASWSACNADRLAVEVRDSAGTTLVRDDDAATTGTVGFDVPTYVSTTEVKVTVTASGPCGTATESRTLTAQNPYELKVDGLEVTQAIQHYRPAAHLPDPTDYGSDTRDNTLQLVTNKSAWVRTYLRSGQAPEFDGGTLPEVDGTLVVRRRVRGVWVTVGGVSSQNGPIAAQDSFADYAAERGNLNASLNFAVPAAWMTGLLRFTVRVSSPYAKCGTGSVTASTTIDVNMTQTLNVAFVSIGYNGPNSAGATLNLPPPTPQQCQAETAWAAQTFPVSGAVNVRLAGTFVLNTPLNDAQPGAGVCSPSWGRLLQNVANLVAADQAANPGGSWIYYGLINGGILPRPVVPARLLPTSGSGCSGVATAGLMGSGNGSTLAHEIGHQFGLPHAPAGQIGPFNDRYPIYEPYDLPADPAGTTNWTMASIGEYGLDTSRGQIWSPASTQDFMSYLGPVWISVYTHDYLAPFPALLPQAIPTGAAAPVDAPGSRSAFERDIDLHPYVHMLGTIGTDGGVEVSSVARLETRRLVDNGVQSGEVAQLLDEEGRVISEAALFSYPSRAGPAGGADQATEGRCAVAFKAMLADPGPGALLRIVRDGEEVWRRERPATEPSLSAVRTRLIDEETAQIEWSYDDESHQDCEVWLRWSDDRGQTWHALTVGVRGESATIGLDSISAAGSVWFQVMAHDGFHTITKESDPIDLPQREPAVAILHPEAATPLPSGIRVHLWGTATSRIGEDLDDEAFNWLVDDRAVGTGRDIWVDNPGPGSHMVRLEVSDGSGVGSAVVHTSAEAAATAD